MPSYNDTSVQQLVINKIPKSVFDTITPSATELYFVEDGATYQTVGNLVTSLASTSTDVQYPSAKCVYDALGALGESYYTCTLNPPIGATLTLTGTDVEKALTRTVPIILPYEVDTNSMYNFHLGMGTLFRRDFLSVIPDQTRWYLLFPDAVRISISGQQFWVNGAYFTCGAGSANPVASSTFTFIGWSQPNSVIIAEDAAEAEVRRTYWANVGLDSTSSTETTPTFADATAVNYKLRQSGTTTVKATMTYNITTNAIDFNFS